MFFTIWRCSVETAGVGWRSTFFVQDNGGKYSKNSLSSPLLQCSLHFCYTAKMQTGGFPKKGRHIYNHGRTFIKINTKWKTQMLVSNGEL